MLALLISAHQAMPPCRRFAMFLFFRGKMYTRKPEVESGFEDLPRRRPILSHDMGFAPGEPPLDRGDNAWPIQATSPKPVRWRSWIKQHEAPVLGMPLWDMKELMEGCVLPFHH